jgi:hypothetical protein
MYASVTVIALHRHRQHQLRSIWCHGTDISHYQHLEHVINQTSRHLQEHCLWNAFLSPSTITLAGCRPNSTLYIW